MIKLIDLSLVWQKLHSTESVIVLNEIRDRIMPYRAVEDLFKHYDRNWVEWRGIEC